MIFRTKFAGLSSVRVFIPFSDIVQTHVLNDDILYFYNALTRTRIQIRRKTSTRERILIANTISSNIV